MPILIPNIEMPVSCGTCKLRNIDEEDRAIACEILCQYVPWRCRNQRYDKCPLVDAGDALLMKIKPSQHEGCVFCGEVVWEDKMV